jgi:uncharacterized protein YjbI with pentapeptide repeats
MGALAMRALRVIIAWRRSVAFGQESATLANLRNDLRSSLDEHYLYAIAMRSISGKSRSFKGHSIENYTAKALLLDGSDFSDSVLTNVTFSRSSLVDCRFSGASLQVPSRHLRSSRVNLNNASALRH